MIDIGNIDLVWEIRIVSHKPGHQFRPFNCDTVSMSWPASNFHVTWESLRDDPNHICYPKPISREFVAGDIIGNLWHYFGSGIVLLD